MAALHIDLDLGTKSCGNYRCPPCFIIKSIVDMAGGETPKLILRNCSNMLLSKDVRLGTGHYHDAVNGITIINAVADKKATFADGYDSKDEFELEGNSYVQA